MDWKTGKVDRKIEIAGVQNIFVENCTFGGYCKRGFYIKTNPDRGGFIRNIYVII